MEAASIPGRPPAHTRATSSATSSATTCSRFLFARALASTTSSTTSPGRSTNVKTASPTATIWALIALGYTLVYGIIELINFAHGEVFMIGSFIAVSLWQMLGVTDATARAR